MKRLLLLTVCVVLAGCSSLEPPELALVGLAPLESNFMEPRMRLDFRLLNTGRKPIQVQGVDLGLEVNGIELARGVDGRGFELPAFGETRASVEVSASIFKLVELLLTLPDAKEFNYQLSGRLHLAGFPRSLPIRRGGSLTREQLKAMTGSDGRRPGVLKLEE